MSVYDLPVRHEFFNAEDPQYPIYVPTGETFEIERSTVERRYVGLETEDIVIKHYIRIE